MRRWKDWKDDYINQDDNLRDKISVYIRHNWETKIKLFGWIKMIGVDDRKVGQNQIWNVINIKVGFGNLFIINDVK
jgi:hypothetical protein